MKLIMIELARRISLFYPYLKKDIRTAHLKTNPQEFIYKNLKFSLLFSLGLMVLFFFIADKAKIPLIFLPLAYIIILFLVFNLAFFKLKTAIMHRQREIDKEVLFAGQYLLIKLYSGKPLLNALIDTTKSYGVASKYIKEIVDDIDIGNPIENALENAIIYSPSEKFRKILFHINNALKLGIDVTNPLKLVLEEITREQQIEIKRYGKKLSALVIFYMLGAIVVPSIGLTVFIAFSSFINFTITTMHFVAAAFFIVIIEFFFMAIFRTVRPTVNL